MNTALYLAKVFDSSFLIDNSRMWSAVNCRRNNKRARLDAENFRAYVIVATRVSMICSQQ
eukprot:scaffold503490_cov15-Prasinocladus_malaysianus.AAC.1